MDRWDWQAVRAYAPSVALMVGGVLVGAVHINLAKHAMLAGIAELFGWVPGLLFAAALGHVAWTSWRLWRAQNVEGLLCGCGGLLGSEIDGRFGPYRKCLACSRNVSARHYD